MTRVSSHFSNFTGFGGSEKGSKSKYQEALDYPNSNADTFVKALQETKLHTMLERFLDDQIAEGVGVIGSDTDNEYKQFLGLYVEDALRNRGEAV